MTEKVTRRMLLTSGALAAATVAVPIAAADPVGALIEANDPTFARISAWLAAYAELEAALDERCRLDATLPHGVTRSHWTIWAEGDDWIEPGDAPEWVAIERVVHARYEAVEAASLVLLDTAAITIAGVVALMKFAAEHSGDLPEEVEDDSWSGAIPFAEAVCHVCADALMRLS